MTTPPKLPPMTEKVRAAIVKKLNLCKQYGYVTLRPEEEHEILCAAMAAYDAIRESLAQSPPAPPAAAPLRADREKVARAIDSVSPNLFDFDNANDDIKKLRFAQADAAIAAMCAEVQPITFNNDLAAATVKIPAERDEARAELAELKAKIQSLAAAAKDGAK